MTTTRIPPSVRGMWTVCYHGVLVGAFPTRDELNDWLAIPAEESVLRVSRSELEIISPSEKMVTT